MRIRKIMAIAIALVLVFSSTGAVFAAELPEEITEATGEQEGQVGGDSTYVDTVRYKVTLPTTESLGFNIDPEGLYGFFADEKNSEATAVDPELLTEYEGKIASTGTASVTNKSSIPIVVTCSFSVETATEGIDFKSLKDELDDEKKEMAIGIMPVVMVDDAEQVVDTNALSVASKDKVTPDKILFGLEEADYEFTYAEGEYDYKQKAEADGVVTETNAYFQIGGIVSKLADWTEIGNEGKEVNLNCVFSFVGAKVFKEGALADDSTGVVVLEDNITYLVEPEPESDPDTPAKFQTIPVVGQPGVDLTTQYSAQGIYTLVGEELLKNSPDELGTVKINGEVIEVAGKGNGAGNGGALWFKFDSSVVLEVEDVITAVIGDTTYTYTVAE